MRYAGPVVDFNNANVERFSTAFAIDLKIPRSVRFYKSQTREKLIGDDLISRKI